jgi:hypothetical protein
LGFLEIRVRRTTVPRLLKDHGVNIREESFKFIRGNLRSNVSNEKKSFIDVLVFVFHLVVEEVMISTSEEILRAVDLFIKERLNILQFEFFGSIN